MKTKIRSIYLAGNQTPLFLSGILKILIQILLSQHSTGYWNSSIFVFLFHKTNLTFYLLAIDEMSSGKMFLNTFQPLQSFAR